MPRIAKKLTDIALRHLKPGTHAVGGQPGLLLHVRKSGTKNWILRIHVGGRRTEFGLGGYPAVSLEKARARAEAERDAVRAGRNPAAERREARAALAAQIAAEAKAAAPKLTVAEAIRKTHIAHEGGFSSPKNAKRWLGTLETHVIPAIVERGDKRVVLGDQPLEDVTTDDLLSILKPLWLDQNETATKVRSRFEKVFDYAKVHGLVPVRDNPCRWRGHLQVMLPKLGKDRQGGHQPSVQWREAPTWFSEVRKMPGTGALALRFLALMAVRSGEVTDMTDAELDLASGLWVIPAERTKTGRIHRVPLSKPALVLIEESPRQAGSPFVFPAPRGGAFSNMALSAVMRRMQATAVKNGGVGWVDEVSKRPAVPHGLRASFRTWAAEAGHDPSLAEIALGHNVGNAVQRAYDRSEMIEKRRSMMEDWAGYLTNEPEVHLR